MMNVPSKSIQFGFKTELFFYLEKYSRRKGENDEMPKLNRKICNIKVKKVIKIKLEMICQLIFISIEWKWFYVTTIDKKLLGKYEYLYYWQKHR